MTVRLGMEIPALVDFPPETKKFVINAVKVILKRFKSDGLIDESVEYAHVLADPLIMYDFITCFDKNRALASNIVIDKTGKPAADDHTELVCGVTLAQIERLLVFTSAKRLFKKGGWQGTRQAGALVPEELKRVLSFYWQLPLLTIYRDLLSADHFQVLGDAILAVRDPATARAVALLSPTDIVKVKAITGTRFVEMLQVSPKAVLMTAKISPEKFFLFSAAAGPGLWRFLETDEATLRFLMGVVGERIQALGPVLPNLGLASARALTDMPASVLESTIAAFVNAFDSETFSVLKDDTFASTHLPGLVSTMRSLGARMGQKGLAAAATQCWEEIKPFVAQWSQERPNS